MQQTQNKKETNTTHRSSTSLVVFIVLTCNVGQTMTGSPQTRSAGQVRKSLQGNKVGQKTGKVRKSTSARTRRSLNGKLSGKRIATKPAPKVDVASDNVNSNDEVEEVDNNQRRLYDKDVEDEDRNNRARSTTLSMQRKSSGRKENGESTVVNLDVPIRGMSKSESRRNQQEYATQRIKAFVTSKVFRKIKFISNDDMLREAMDWVMKHEKVPQEKRLMYRVVYESVFNESLNAKRSTCETAGRKIVVDKTMPKFQEKGKELFTMEELCKLRRAETEREKEASFWFFGEFLSCVVGKRQWIVQKKYQLISQATMTGSSDKLVTISDEAFALLMYENYKDKWTKQGNEQAGQSVPSGKKVIRGKFTVQNSGTCKYGGWSHAGMKRFNELYDLVVEDRACPQAAAVEKEFLDYCVKEGNKKKVGGRQSDEPTAVEGSASMLQPRYIRAAWDLNHE